MSIEKWISPTIVACLLIVIACSSVAGQLSADILEPNKPLSREMKGGDVHRYKFSLKPSELLQVQVEQKGVDVELKLVDSDGKVLATIDSPNGTIGPEKLNYVAEKLGDLTLIISALEENAPIGNYTISCAPLRTVSAIEKQKLEADGLYDDARALLSQQTASSFDEALEKFKAAGRLYAAIDEKGERAGEWLRISGVIHFNRGDNKTALEFFERAFAYFQAGGFKIGQGRSLTNIGVVQSYLGDNPKAIRNHEQALMIFRAINDRTLEAAALTNLGLAYLALRESNKALEHFNLSLAVYESLGDKYNQASVLHNTGVLYSDLGAKSKALDHLQRALVLRKAAKDLNGEGTTLKTLGNIYEDVGKRQQALDYYLRSLPIFKSVGNGIGLGATLNSIGLLYSTLGEKQKALQYLDQAGTIFKELGYQTGLSATLNNIGEVYASLGQNGKALEQYQRTLLSARELNDKSLEGRVLNNIGSVHYEQLNKRDALEYYNRSLVIFVAIGDADHEAQALNNIGNVQYALGENQKALDYYLRALPGLRAVGNRSIEADALNNLALVWNRLGNARFSTFYSKQAVNVYQELRYNIRGLDKSTQKTYLSVIGGAYTRLANLLVSQNRLSEAQQVLTAFKDQQFFDVNQVLNVTPRRLLMTPREEEMAVEYEKTSTKVGDSGERVKDLKLKIGNRKPSEQESALLLQAGNDLTVAMSDFRMMLKQAERAFFKPPDLSDRIGASSELMQLQRALRDLGSQTSEETVAIYQVVGEDTFSALLITHDSIDKVSVPIKGSELNQKATNLWALLQSDKYDTRVLSKKIYDVIFAPLKEKIPKGIKTIMWSMDGNLRYIPMAALFDGEKFLVERYNHAVFTRADPERMTRPVTPSWSGSGFGTSLASKVNVLGSDISFDALPGVTTELSTIFKPGKDAILNGPVVVDEEFSRKKFLDTVRSRRPVVHISSHFVYRPGDEARSFLLMGDKTAFTLDELKTEVDLFNGVELLTLSGCNTAANQPGADGREIDGFAELAQRLGAGAVMASLWQVSDTSTPWMMREFYANRQFGKKNKAAALRTAQLDLLYGTTATRFLPRVAKGISPTVQISRSPDGKRDKNDTRSESIYLAEKDAPVFKKITKRPLAHPYYWAPFVVYGNWR